MGSSYYVKLENSGNLLGTPTNGLAAASAPLYTTVFGGAVVPAQPYHVAFTPASPTTPAYNVADFEGDGLFLRGDLDLNFGTLSSTMGYNDTRTENWNRLRVPTPRSASRSRPALIIISSRTARNSLRN
ncbi:MAG: hypothetical protein ABW048_12700 [Sphingobium sp.]